MNYHILVTGAGGFIGKVLVVYLLKRGWKVRAMVRGPGRPIVPPDAALEVVYADMRDRSALVAGLQGVNVVVHLAAAKSDEKWSYDVNVGGAERLIEACRLVGCSRIINISTQSVKIERKGTYARTKHRADKVFEDSGLAVTNLLPSVVYGEERAGVFGTVLNMVQKLPFVPVLGNGNWICAPVYVGDLAEAVCRCIENEGTIGKTYDIAGPNLIAFNDFIDRLADRLRLRRRKLHVPFGISLLAARALGALLPKPPITVSNVLGSNQNTQLNGGPAKEDFGFDPIDFDTGLQRVLSGGAVTSPASTEGSVSRDAELAAECVLFTRYLIGREPVHELIERYIVANHTLALDAPKGQGELEFVRRHPFALPLIDAAAGLLNPQSALRKKAFLMAAILEATPAYADFFLPAPELPCWLYCRLVWQGVRAIGKLALGIPLLWIARRS